MSAKSIFRNILVLSLVTWGLCACSGMMAGTGTLVRTAEWGLQDGTRLQVKPTEIPLLQTSLQAGCLEDGCHASLKAEQKQYVHPPFEQGKCLVCHSVDHPMKALTPEQTLELCYSCHTPDSLGYSHPAGPGVIDPRNGQMLTCLSCHNQHSAVNPDQLRLDGRGELCVSCHTDFLQPTVVP